MVQIKNPFGSLQTNPKADAWLVPPFFFLKKCFCETPYSGSSLRLLPGTSVSPTSKTAQTPFTTSSLTFTADATHLAGEAAPLRWQGNSAAENAQQLKEKASNTVPLH